MAVPPSALGGCIGTCRSDHRFCTKPPIRAGTCRHLQLVIQANAEVAAVIVRHIKLAVTLILRRTWATHETADMTAESGPEGTASGGDTRSELRRPGRY